MDMQIPLKGLGAAIAVAFVMTQMSWGQTSAAPGNAPAPGTAQVAEGILTLHVGDYVVQFRETSAWTLRSADFQGHPILTPTGAYQSVLNIKDEPRWIGTGHGFEPVESIVLEVDGQPHPVAEGLTAQGTSFTLVKHSQLGPYRHTARVGVTRDGITEDLHYTWDPALAAAPAPGSEGGAPRINFMYAFMHCFANTTRDWVVGLAEDQEERGTFLDDNSFTLKKDIRWALVYDPTAEVGVAYAYPEIYEGAGKFKNSFWNRPRDNKLYLQVIPSQTPGETFGYSVRLQAFAAPEADWEAAGRSTLQPLLTAAP